MRVKVEFGVKTLIEYMDIAGIQNDDEFKTNSSSYGSISGGSL